MRIIGGKDYYDRGLSHGIDTSVVFVRKAFQFCTSGSWPSHKLPKINIRDGAEEIQKVRWYDATVSWKKQDVVYKMEPVSVFFCGVIYRGIRVYWYSVAPFKKMEGTGGTAAKREYREVRQETFWDLNSLNRWGRIHGIVVPTESSKYVKFENPFRWSKLSSDRLLPYLEGGIVVATWFHDQPKLSVRNHTLSKDVNEDAWLCNSDSLKEFDFIKLVDPVRAFQEISMWVGGVLPKPGNKLVEITDDKIKLAKHGMDKHSFRNLPEKSK
jgi:hypothetical protein